MLNKIRQRMMQNAIDWFTVYSNDPHLSEYTAPCDRYREKISGFTGSAGTLLVGYDEAYLWTDSRYFLQAAEELDGSSITLMRAGESGVPTLEGFLQEHMWDGQVLAFDKKTISYGEYKRLSKMLPDSTQIVDGAAVLKDLTDKRRDFSDIDEVPIGHCGKSAGEKLKSLRTCISKRFSQDKTYTYIISDLTSIMWLFNLRGEDIVHVPVAYSYACVTAHDATLYLSRKSLSTQALKMLEEAGVGVREYSEFYKALGDVATDIVIADPYKNNARILENFDTEGMLEECIDHELIRKPVKNSTEIKGMESAHIKDAVTMIRFIKAVKGKAAANDLGNECELGAFLDDMRLQNGCSDLSFDTICAYAHNAAVVHYTAKKETAADIQPHGLLLVDSGGQYRFEGTTDITRTICLGEITKEEKKAYTTVLRANLRLMDMIFPEGSKGVLLDAAAEEILWENGYYCGHGIGHGVGCYLSVHESEARISRIAGRECALVPGIIISDEPGVYVEGKFGVRLENLLLVMAAGKIEEHNMCRFTPLTLVPFDMEAVDRSMLSKREMEILSEYNRLIWEKVSPFLEEDEKDWLKENIDID